MNELFDVGFMVSSLARITVYTVTGVCLPLQMNKIRLIKQQLMDEIGGTEARFLLRSQFIHY